MYKIVKKSDAVLRVIADNKKSFNYITKDISPGLSLAVTEGNNFSEVEFAKYNRIYYVIDGELLLAFDGEENVLSLGDSCYISKGTEYTMSGTFKAIVVNQPAFGTL